MTAPQTEPNEGRVGAEELFRLHAAFVARFLFRLGVRPDGIEDAVQEVFLVVHRQGGYRPGAAKPTSYLGNLAMHAAAAYRRRERVRAARETDAPVEDVASTRSDPVEVLETNESLRRLQDALGLLEPDLRTTLVLAEIEGESCTSIAAAMGIPVGTVYWRLHQARKKFQHAMHVAGAARPQRELAVQGAGFAAGLRPQRKERAGMLVLSMTSSSWMDSEARDLLRLGSERHPLRYLVQEGLERHRHLAASAAPTPSWANGLGAGAKSAAWFAVSALAATGVAVLVVLKTASHPADAPSAVPPTAIAARTQPAAVSSSPWRPSPMPGTAPAETPALPVELLPQAASPAPVSASSVSATHAAMALDAPAAVAPRAAASVQSPVGADDMGELREVARAERLLPSDPAQALALARASEVRFPQGYLREERSYVAIMALLAMGRVDEARPEVARFLRAYPDGAFSRRVREASRAALLEQ
jgi:RNA polymerase sigma-70 factor, ECF subfamily